MGPKGLGLGLNIAQSLANILDHKINLRSQAGHGCLFSINVPIIQSMLKDQQVQPTASMNLQGVGVLCVDNEQAILEGMSTLLRAWQCQVFTAINAQQAKEIYRKHEDEIDIFLVDYQLTEAKNEDLNLTMHKLRNDERNKENNDHQINGIELIKQLRSTSQYSLPAVLITATTDENLMALAKQNNISYLQKIIKPLALRALMSALLTKELAKNYANK